MLVKYKILDYTTINMAHDFTNAAGPGYPDINVCVATIWNLEAISQINFAS